MLKELFTKNSSDKYVIVGLGNPEQKYDGTRHNIGFMCIDKIASDYNIPIITKKHQGLIGKGIINGKKVILVKPLTYMNNSGQCVSKIVDYEKIDYENNLLIISDDIHLPTGKLRLRLKGSDGGHNGLKDIIMHLNSSQFPRLRMGVGETPKGGDQIKHVLGHFNSKDKEIMDLSMKKVSDNIPFMLENGVEQIMNKING